MQAIRSSVLPGLGRNSAITNTPMRTSAARAHTDPARTIARGAGCVESALIRREVGGEIAPHGRGDAREIGLGDADEAEAECRAPVLLAANERELGKQRADRGVACGQVIDGAPERLELAVLGLEDRALADAPD